MKPAREVLLERPRRAWLEILTPPFAAIAQQQAGYWLAVWVCDHHGEIFLHAVSLLCLAAALVALVSAWRTMRGVERGVAGADALSARDRVLFMTRLAVLEGGISIFLIVTQWIVIAFLRPCPT